MGNLFYNVLGGTAGTSIATTHNSNYDLFSNVKPFTGYWSATEYAPATINAWTFGFSNGGQTFSPKAVNNFAWAVHPGNVGAATLPGASVPDPGTLWLMVTGLVGLAARRRLALR